MQCLPVCVVKSEGLSFNQYHSKTAEGVRMRKLALIVHIAILLLYLRFKNELSSDLPFIGNWLAMPNATKMYLSLFAICCALSWLFTAINKEIAFQKIDIVNNLISLITFVCITAIINVNYVNFKIDQFDFTANIYIVNAMIIFLTSTDVLRQWDIYLNGIILHNIFTNNANANNFNHKNIKTISLIICILYNVILNCYCFFYIHMDIAFNFGQYISFILMLTVFSIPYYILPELKYDIHHFQMKIAGSYFVLIFFTFFQLIWFYVLKYYLSKIFCDVFFVLTILFSIVIVSVWPMILESVKIRQFIKKCTKENVDTLWSNYIIQCDANPNQDDHDNNYQKFLHFLARIYCAKDLLFVIDVIQYKNKWKTIINEIDYGYSLPFNMTNDILPISPIVMDLDNTINTNNNNNNKVIILDFIAFYNKYIDEQASSLKISFLSIKQSKSMRETLDNKMKNLESSNVDHVELIPDIITLFDKVLIEINITLQLLFREYQLQ